MGRPSRRILLIEICFHGDMLLTTPVISSLKKNYPDARIDALFYQDTIPILSENPEINVLHDIKNRKARAPEKITNFFYLIRILCANKCDLIVNLTNQWMIAILVCLLNARVKIPQDYHHRQSVFRRNGFTYLIPLQDGNVVESNLSVLAPLRLKSLAEQTTVSYPSASWKHTCRGLDHADAGQNYVVTQPTTQQTFKCWDNAKSPAVINALYARGYEVVLTFDPDEGGLACVSEITQGCRTLPVTALAGKVTFPKLGTLINHVQLFTGAGSAPVHIAAAANMPLTSLFGTIDHIFWRPWLDNMIQF